ncbi:hypothetical protein I3760_10G134800 [Carya illinoinensis]|nr:hypothetical protein I3760_10G134800 [Carya illinoinensis]
MPAVTTKIKRGTANKTRRASTSKDVESSFVDLEIGASDTSTQNCCIYTVPMTLVEVSGQKWFEPRVVSIGHYNCKNLNDKKHKRLQMIQKHKQQFCSNLQQSHAGKSMEDQLMEIIRPEAEKIEFKYAKNDSFLRMLVLDVYFILELFRVLGKSRKIESNDSNHHLDSMEWAIPHFYRDLLLLENQIPFVFLEKLYQTTNRPDDQDDHDSLTLLALRFFNKVMRRSDEELRKIEGEKDLNNSLHLLDLVRQSFITPDLDQPPEGENSETVPVIYCITKLLKAGIKIKLREADSFLAVKFKNGVIEMPKITLDYFMQSFLVNCRAFEQLHEKSPKHITVYAYFLACLVNTAKDVEYLYKRNIIDSYVGKNSEVVRFINKLGKEKEVETDQFYLYDFFNGVNRHYKSTYSVQFTGIEDVEALNDLETGVSYDTSTLNCCIYRVPVTIREINGKKWYDPRVVSIGHYHYNKHERLQRIQKHKWKFYSILVSKARERPSLEDLTKSIRPLEAQARGFYSEKIEFESDQENDTFLKMLILDGCFILELFRVLGKQRQLESDVQSDHPISSVAWALPHLYGDLLLLENQIPFVVLKTLFDETRRPDDHDSLTLLALRFFNKVMRRSDAELSKMIKGEKDLNNSLHLLDLVRTSFITHDLDQLPKGKNSETVPVIYCITKLLKAGIKIKLREADSFLAVKFKNGVIEMPKITFDYFMHSFVVNCRAFEQLHEKISSKHITVYAYFLACLVNTAKDVEYLYERNIIDSYVGKNSEVVQFINKLGKEKEVETDQFYLYDFFNGVNRHYKSTYSVQFTGIEDVEALNDLEIGVSYDTSTLNCCIYRVPVTIREINGNKWYDPRVVSIGHYHYNKHERLQRIQKHKWKFYSILVSKARESPSLEYLMKKIRRLEAQARGFYSEKIEFESDQENDTFLKMLILDGCFILELFRVLGKQRQLESDVQSDHPISSVAWALPHLYGDLLLLENQIPFVVLKTLFGETRRPDDQDDHDSLTLLALRFFNKVMRRSDEELRKIEGEKDLNNSLHLLDLVRQSFITPDLDQPPEGENSETVPVIYCITKLLKAGITIKLREADSFLAVKFKNGVIEMPKITVDYFMHSFVVNCRAFEQLHEKISSKHITVYAYFLDCLVNTAKDVEYLYERKIIASYVGKNSEVVQFINNMGKEIDVETHQFYLYNFFGKVNRRYKNTYHVNWTGLKHRYCNTPWSCISASAAFVLLGLTFLQTYYTIYAYVNPK